MVAVVLVVIVRGDSGCGDEGDSKSDGVTSSGTPINYPESRNAVIVVVIMQTVIVPVVVVVMAVLTVMVGLAVVKLALVPAGAVVMTVVKVAVDSTGGVEMEVEVKVVGKVEVICVGVAVLVSRT